MKNTNTNNPMTQAMDFAQVAGMMQAMQAMMPMMQALAPILASEQAQGAGNASEQGEQAQASAWGAMCERKGAGKAQGKRKGADKAQGEQAQGIAWMAISRQNERQTVYDVRQAMVQGKPFEGLVKAWVVLNEKKVPTDARVLKICEDMRCACLQAKGMKVKGADNAHFEVASMVTVKRAFYCAMRGMPIVETRNDERPATRGKKAQGK